MADPAKALAKLKDEIEAAHNAWNKKRDEFKKVYKALCKVKPKPRASDLDKLSILMEKTRIEILNAKQELALTQARVDPALKKIKAILKELDEDVRSELI
jgi:hypothetical protein